MRAILFAVITLISLYLAPTRVLGRPPAVELPLLVRIARCGNTEVRPQLWVRQHLEAAAQVLGLQGLRLRPRLESFSPKHCTALDAKARNSLARHVPPSGVTVLVVQRVRDLSLPSYDLMGVHWRYGGNDPALAGRRYILLTARAKPPVLAHELGHYFGLPHDPRGGNLMTPGPSAPIWREQGRRRPKPFSPELTPRQGRRLRAAALRWLRVPSTLPR